nr:flagellar hook assembly protein FlgD [uncultured Holophaga sp.]
MDTGLTTSATSSTSSTSSTDKTIKKDLDKDAFLMLLVAQLKNQDPTQSQDPNQMVEQMTSFSSLEQAQNTNSTLKAIQAQNQALLQTETVGLVGKTVETTSPQFELTGGSATMRLDLEGQANVTVTIKDANGATVAILNKGNLGAGSHSIDWNGRDANGNALAEGTYTASVSAMDATGNSVTNTLATRAKVDSVLFNGDTAYIVAGGRQIPLSSVTQIYA